MGLKKPTQTQLRQAKFYVVALPNSYLDIVKVKRTPIGFKYRGTSSSCPVCPRCGSDNSNACNGCMLNGQSTEWQAKAVEFDTGKYRLYTPPDDLIIHLKTSFKEGRFCKIDTHGRLRSI